MSILEIAHLVKYVRLQTLTLTYVFRCQQSDVDLMAANEKSIREGLAEVYLPDSVFYNPVQEFNRDLTIAVIREYTKTINSDTLQKQIHENANSTKRHTVACSHNSEENEQGNKDFVEKKFEGLKILEALSASGLRSVRFAKEISGIKQIIANDFDETAVKFIKRNIEHNNVAEIIVPSCADASLLMYQNRKAKDRFNVIDLDPYGSATQFLDAAVQSIHNGGLLCVTCTDVAILCGNAPETCHAKYGSMPLRASYSHEMALRIVLRCIESHANVYSRYIVPLLSVSVDFYVRVFVQVFTSQNAVKDSATKISLVYECTGCGVTSFQQMATKVPTGSNNFKYVTSNGPPVGETCSHCGGRHRVGGPIWTGPLHDLVFVENMLKSVQTIKESLKTSDRIIGLLNLIMEELPDRPLYYVVDDLCRILHCTLPRFIEFRSAILHAGYRVSLSHADKNSVKTDAPASVIWDILRCWVRDHPVREERLQGDSVASRLLAVVPNIVANFTVRPDANPTSRAHGLLRWQHNPTPNWGPQARASHGDMISLEERRQKGMEKARNRKRARKQTDSPKELKNFMCKMFKQGQCSRDVCRYSHDIEANLNCETVDNEKPN